MGERGRGGPVQDLDPLLVAGAGGLLLFALQQLPAALWVLDPDLRFRFAAGAGLDLIGLDHAELVGARAADVLGTDDPRHPALVVITRALTLDRIEHFEQEFLGHVWRTRVGPLRDEDGHIVGTVGLSVDDTAQIERERLLTAAVEAMERTERTQDEFLTVIAHQLRTPLAALSGLGETLSREDVGPDTRRDLAERFEHHVGELDRMIDRLLLFAEVRLGRLSLAPRAIDLAAAVAEGVERARGERPHAVVVRAEPGQAVWVDPEAFGHVMANVVGNAIRHSPAGVPARVETMRLESDMIVVVADRGPGVPGTARDTIFEPFAKAEAAVGDHRGVGVGLAIAEALVHSWGGRMWLEPSDEGAVFCFTVPLADAYATGAAT